MLAFALMPQHKQSMPTLTRLITFLTVCAAIVYGAMFALANFVAPQRQKMTVEIPASRIKPVPVSPQTTSAGPTQAPIQAPTQE